jgi:hypothetical protein
MSIINRRNAIIGFFAWEGAKLVAKQKARKAIPGVEERRPNKAAMVVAAAAAVAGGVMFWRWWQENSASPPEVPSSAPETPTEAK